MAAEAEGASREITHVVGVAMPGGSEWCFDPAAFEVEEGDFDAGAFVASHARVVPLPVLRENLDRYVRESKAKLVAHVHSDYAGFVQLSARLDDFKTAAHQLRAPIDGFRDLAASAVQAAELALARVDDVFRQRDAARARTVALEHFEEAHSLAARIDDLLGSLRTRDVSSLSGSLVDTMRRAHREYEQRCLMLERVADLCSALEALLKQRGVNTDVGGADGDEGGASDATAAAEGPLFLRMLRPKLHQAHSELGELLSDTAGRLLRGAWDDEDGDEDDTTRAMPSCLRAFALCDNASAIEHLIATELVQGVLSDTFTPGRLDGGSRGQFKGASSCFEALVSFIRAPRVRRILVASAGIHGLDVAGNAIWAPAVHALLNGFPSFFSAGLPDVFVANFDAFHSFMDSMFEGFEESLPGAPLALRLHPATLEVETKWHRALPVYFQVRSREVRAPVEEALQRSVEAAPPSEGDAETGLYLSASTAVWKALICLWKPGVYVPALASRFLKLTAQAVGRYVAWLSAPRQLKDKRREKPSGQSAGGAGGAVADASAAKKARDEAGSGESGEEGETSDRAGADDSSCWKGVTADALLAASCDARRIRELVRSILVGRMRSAVDEIDGASDVGAPVLYAAVEPLSAVSEQLRELVARQLKDRCVAGLAHVRGIPATYRMTSKPLPISHSQFVEKVFAPLQDFLRSHSAQLPPSSEDTRAWAASIAMAVASEYESTLQSLLATVEKMDASLKWLRTSGAGEAGGAVPAGDSDKIRVQVLYDVRRFTADAAALGSDTKAPDGVFARLEALVKDGERFVK